MIKMAESKELTERRIAINTGPIRKQIEELSAPEMLADLFLRAIAIKDEASQLVACNEVLRLLVGSPRIGEIIRMVGDNPMWSPFCDDPLAINRANLDQLCVFLIRWGFPEVALNISFWDEGVSDEVFSLAKRYANHKYHLLKSRGDDPPISLDTGLMLWQVREKLGRDHIETSEMAELTDAEFITEYMIQMLSYDVPATCHGCYRQIEFWLDCRMLAGATYCPLCFPAAVNEAMKFKTVKGRKTAEHYWVRAARLLPRRFMAPDPPPKYFELRPQP